MSNELVTLNEYADSRSALLSVDEAAGVIRGVKIIGHESKNGRTYPPETLRKALPLYEGAKVNVNHAAKGQQRDYRDRIGNLRNVAMREGAGLFGDFHFNPKHPLAEQLIWDAKNAPQNVGFSHVAEGKVKVVAGKNIVEEIQKVEGVDLVANAATVNSLFEHVENDALQSLTGLAESRDKQSPGDLGAVWLREMMSQGFANPQMQVPAQGNPMLGQSPGGAADAGIKQAIKAMVNAVLDDQSMDTKAAMGRIVEILKSQERIMGKGGNSDDPNAKPGEESDPLKGGEKKPEGEEKKNPFGESVEPTLAEVLEENRRLKAEGMARGLLETAGIEATQALVEGVALHKGEAEMKKFIESMPKGRTPGPRSVAPSGTRQTLTESKVPDGSSIKDVAAFLRSK